MYNVIATDAFERDYGSALAYIAYELAAPIAARHMMDSMDASINRISDNPFINAISIKPTLAKLEYREEFVGNYVLLYRIEGDNIVIKRLFHMSQNYEQYV